MGLILFLIVWIVAAQGEADALEAFLATAMLAGLVGLLQALAALPLLRLILILLGIGVFLSGCDSDE